MEVSLDDDSDGADRAAALMKIAIAMGLAGFDDMEDSF
jgi:hypothetical protein